MKTLLLNLAGIAVTAVAFLFGGYWGNVVGVTAALLSIWAAIRQYSEYRPYELYFDKTSWTVVPENKLEMRIPATQHRKGAGPSLQFFVCSGDGGFGFTMFPFTTDKEGNVIAQGPGRFEGKILIR